MKAWMAKQTKHTGAPLARKRLLSLRHGDLPEWRRLIDTLTRPCRSWHRVSASFQHAAVLWLYSRAFLRASCDGQA